MGHAPEYTIMQILNWLTRSRPAPQSSSPKASPENEAQRIVRDVRRIHAGLKEQKDLRPCEEVNALFEELVEICIQPLPRAVEAEILSSSQTIELLPSLHNLCSQAECHLESHWATKIVSSSPKTALEDFPYYSNYVALARLELAAMHAVCPNTPSKIAFLGCGPLPLTSLLLSQSVSAPRVLNIDHDPLAVTLATRLCAEVGQEMDFRCCDALDPGLNLRDCDVVYLAALVGTGQAEKEQVLRSVVGKMRMGALVVVRSARGARRLLYPEFDAMTTGVRRYMDVCLVVHPFGEVVNSVIVGKVRG